MMEEWRLDGVYLAPYTAIPEEIAWFTNTRYLGRIEGVGVFEAEDMPQGTLELWRGDQRLLLIRGLGKQEASRG